ncbi:MAG TPA: ABC transporter permease [Stellaceae bacterium]|nr:ABC transporter permease [Stellaceae bacterium]
MSVAADPENAAAARLSRAWLARYAPATLSLVAGLALWEIAGRMTSAAFMAPLSETLLRFWQLARAGTLLSLTLSSGALFATGLGLGIVIGLPSGLLLARVRLLREALDVYIMVLYATPMVALIPFILSLMGFGFAPKVLVVFLFAVFPILYNTVEGARSIKPELIEVARSYRSSEWALWREVMLPYTLPFAMTGIRQAIGRALVGMIAAEFWLSATGLGGLIMNASQNFDTGAVFAAVLIMVAAGLLLMRLGMMLENRVARWRG